MASRGAGARAKGANFERAIAKYLTEKTGKEWKRGIGQTRGGGKEISDVLSEDITWIHIECKNQASCNIKKAMLQAIDDCGDKTPVVITKDTGKDTLITMRIEDWIPWLNNQIEHYLRDLKKK